MTSKPTYIINTVYGGMDSSVLELFYVENIKCGTFYLQTNKQKILRSVPGKSVFLNCGYHIDNILAFLDYYSKYISKQIIYFQSNYS